MQTIPVTDGAVVEIISAYAACNQQVSSVAAGPAWVVIGGFYMPRTATVRLEAVGSVSGAPRILTTRLFEVVGAAPVSGSTTEDIDGTIDERALSGAFELLGGKVYQVQAQVVGSATGFGVIRSVQPISS